MEPFHGSRRVSFLPRARSQFGSNHLTLLASGSEVSLRGNITSQIPEDQGLAMQPLQGGDSDEANDESTIHRLGEVSRDRATVLVFPVVEGPWNLLTESGCLLTPLTQGNNTLVGG